MTHGYCHVLLVLTVIEVAMRSAQQVQVARHDTLSRLAAERLEAAGCALGIQLLQTPTRSLQANTSP